MQIFKYGEKEINYLKKKDKKLGAAIERIGMIEREVIPDLFTGLVYNIIGQQISNKAAEIVRNKLTESLGVINPSNIVNSDTDQIQKCGLSARKVSYIKGIGKAVLEGKLNLSEFPFLSDTEIIKRLTELPGVGVWTAEMLLIFSMERPDVVSRGDLGIKKGMCFLYGHKEIDNEKFEIYKKRYSPYGTVASLYLWDIAKTANKF